MSIEARGLGRRHFGAGRSFQPKTSGGSVLALSLFGNILWLVFGGFWLALGYGLAGLVLCLTIIGIPFGVQAFKLAELTLRPFGRGVVDAPDGGGCLSIVFNVLWLLLFGWELFLGHLASGVILCLTIIGIPFGIQAFKLSVLALWPFGRMVVKGP
jgi:uncharacterized membrane protein YccF (DUF307 family)